MPAFDQAAAGFERLRALPDAAIEAIVKALVAYLPSARARLLDIGAGTGRFGKHLNRAVDRYLGLDLSAAMLAQFRAAIGANPWRLVRAEARHLPFPGRSFDGVLLAHVLSGAGQWRDLVAEARRVLCATGTLLVVQRTAPADGLDARLRTQLRTILASLGVSMPEAGKARGEAQTLLVSAASWHQHEVAARFEVQCSPRDFLDRHPTGVRFAALEAGVQQESLQRLRTWATTTFGALDASYREEHTCELDAFRFQ